MKLDNLELYKHLKLEVIVKTNLESLITTIFKDAGISGYTILRDVAGQGHDFYHEAISNFNDESGLLMFISVAREEKILQVAQGLKTLFEKNAGVAFITETNVLRSEYFN